MKRREDVDNWIQREQDKHLCACGCGGIIRIQRYHFWTGIPEFLRGHNRCGCSFTEDHKNKISESHKGENNPMFGKTLSQSIKDMLSEAWKGVNNPNWQGGKSFEPYCPKFNFSLKEKIRETYNRRCYFCGKTEEENGRRLDIHHIDDDKQQGCNGKLWFLIPLCISCHTTLHNDKRKIGDTRAKQDTV